MSTPPSRAVWALLLVQFVGALGFTITLPLMPYYAATFGADPFTVGLLGATYAGCALVAGPILGRLSDRQGRRPWLLFSQLGTLVGFVLTAVGGSLGMLILGRVIDGLSGGNQVIVQAYVGDVTRPEERTRVYGLLGAAFGLGAIAGPVLGGGLSQLGSSVPFWVAAALAALTLAATVAFLPESRPAVSEDGSVDTVRGLAQLVGESGLRRLLALYTVIALVFGLFVASIGLFMQLQLGVTPLVAGLLVGYYGLASVVAQVVLVPRATRRMGEGPLVPVALLALAAAMAVLAVAQSIAVSLAGVTLLVLGMALLRPAVTSLLSQAAGPARQGTVMGATQVLQSLTDIVTPLASGALIVAGAPAAPFITAALLALVGLLLRPVVPALPQVEASMPLDSAAS